MWDSLGSMGSSLQNVQFVCKWNNKEPDSVGEGAIFTTEMIVLGEWVMAVVVVVALVAPSKRHSIPVAGGTRQISGGQRRQGHWNSPVHVRIWTMNCAVWLSKIAHICQRRCGVRFKEADGFWEALHKLTAQQSFFGVDRKSWVSFVQQVFKLPQEQRGILVRVETAVVKCGVESFPVYFWGTKVPLDFWWGSKMLHFQLWVNYGNKGQQGPWEMVRIEIACLWIRVSSHIHSIFSSSHSKRVHTYTIDLQFRPN